MILLAFLEKIETFKLNKIVRKTVFDTVKKPLFLYWHSFVYTIKGKYFLIQIKSLSDIDDDEANRILHNIAKCKPDTQCAKRTSDYINNWYENSAYIKILIKEFELRCKYQLCLLLPVILKTLDHACGGWSAHRK